MPAWPPPSLGTLTSIDSRVWRNILYFIYLKTHFPPHILTTRKLEFTMSLSLQWLWCHHDCLRLPLPGSNSWWCDRVNGTPGRFRQLNRWRTICRRRMYYHLNILSTFSHKIKEAQASKLARQVSAAWKKAQETTAEHGLKKPSSPLL